MCRKARAMLRSLFGVRPWFGVLPVGEEDPYACELDTSDGDAPNEAAGEDYGNAMSGLMAWLAGNRLSAASPSDMIQQIKAMCTESVIRKHRPGEVGCSFKKTLCQNESL